MDKLEKMLADISQEIEDTRQKFPGNHHKLAVLSEEVGELAQAMLQHEYDGQPAINVYREAVQVAAMAIRLAIEGDHSFKYRHPEKIRWEHGTPTKDGWYAVMFSYDPREGQFHGAAKFNNGNWVWDGTSTICGYAGPFDDGYKAALWAKDNDYETLALNENLRLSEEEKQNLGDGKWQR